MVVTVKKVGGSMAVLIPKAIAREMELAEGTELELSNDADVLQMRKRSHRVRRPLSEIVAEIDPKSYRRRNAEMNGDGPVGREFW